jgi:hypothetical protein
LKPAIFILVKCLLPVLIIPVMLYNCSHDGDLVIYPPIPGLETSDLYQVKVNGRDIWTEKFRTRMDIPGLPDWFTSEPYTQEQQELHFTNLSGSGSMRVHVEVSGPVIIKGFNENHRVENVSFENCMIESKPLKSITDEVFMINEFVGKVNVR